MGTEIDYLYGDSTPSPLKINFIALLRDVFDFGVDVLLHEGRVRTAMQELAKLSEATEKEIVEAEGLVATVSEAIDHAAVGDGDSIAVRCAAKIRRGVHDLARSEADAARAAVAMERARAAQVASSAHSACAKAFETLVLRQNLPDSAIATRVWIEGASHYLVRLHGQTPYGLKWTLGLDVPPSHPLAEGLRISRIVERLEVEAAEATGLIRKEIRFRRQRFDRLYLTELVIDPTRTTVKLRATPDAISAGFDVLFSGESAQVELCRILPGGAAPDSPDTVPDEDASRLQSLRGALVKMVDKLNAADKRSLVAASLDETPLHELETPRVLVERIVAGMAPTVEQIAKRSPVPGELAIKRVINETHREEVFVLMAELLRKLEPLPFEERRVFDPFNLWEAASRRPPLGVQPAVSDRAPSSPAAHAPVEPALPGVKQTATTRPLVLEDITADVPTSSGRVSAEALRVRDDKMDGSPGAASTGKWPTLPSVSTRRAGI